QDNRRQVIVLVGQAFLSALVVGQTFLSALVVGQTFLSALAAGPRAFTERTGMSAQDRQECLPHQEMQLRTDKNVCPTRRCCSGQTRMSAPPGDAAQDRQECLPTRYGAHCALPRRGEYIATFQGGLCAEGTIQL